MAFNASNIAAATLILAAFIAIGMSRNASAVVYCSYVGVPKATGGRVVADAGVGAPGVGVTARRGSVDQRIAEARSTGRVDVSQWYSKRLSEVRIGWTARASADGQRNENI